METIKNYLETMFANMPNTEAVLKAKSELLQMMEDKYNELIGEGESENSAVGTVISEFGNLEEIADELGLSEEINQKKEMEDSRPRRMISLEEAKEYLAAEAKSGLMIAFGVLLCILSVDGVMISEFAKMNEVVGIAVMFALIAVAVGIFVYNGVLHAKWDYVKKEACQIDLTTANFVRTEKDRYASTHALRLTVGIVLCVVCWLPTVMLDFANLEELGGAMLFVIVGLGVFAIVYTCNVNGSFDNLLNVNADGTVSSKYGKNGDVEYINDTAALVMNLYWPVITSAYLIWSFVTFEWWRTWIIWPVAAIIFGVLKSALSKK